MIGVLETIDYLWGTIEEIQAGNSSRATSLVLWSMLRLSSIYLMFNALMWTKKIRKSS